MKCYDGNSKYNLTLIHYYFTTFTECCYAEDVQVACIL